MKIPNVIKKFINIYKNPLNVEGSFGATRSRILSMNSSLDENDKLPLIWIKLLKESKKTDKYKFLSNLVPQTRDKNNIQSGKYTVYDLLLTFSRNAELIQDKFSEIDARFNQNTKNRYLGNVPKKKKNHSFNNDLQLDTDFPYPIKTKSSIWTVRNKPKKN